MALTLDAITLPDDLIWTDEFNWSPIEQSQEHTVTGALILDSGIKQAGRGITLQGSEQSGWITRQVLETLYATLTSNATMVLTLQDGRTFSVVFDHQSTPLESEPIIDYSLPENNDMNTLTLRLIIV